MNTLVVTLNGKKYDIIGTPNDEISLKVGQSYSSDNGTDKIKIELEKINTNK